MEHFIIIILCALLLLSLCKWLKWKFTALTTIMFVIEQYREPTSDETKHYGEIVIKKMLHISRTKL